MTLRRQSGKAMGSLVLLLVLVSGLGAWNYHRNWQIEKAQEHTRPYASYKTEDLEALREAYSGESQTAEAKLKAAQNMRARVSGDRGSIAQNVDQFSKTTRTSANIRSAASDLAAQQSQLADLDKELSHRSEFGSGMQLHLKRLTTF